MAVLRSIHKGFGILYFDTKSYIFSVQSSDVPTDMVLEGGTGGGLRVGYRDILLGNKKTVTWTH